MANRDEFRPTANWRSLLLRAKLLAQLRVFFARYKFTEVETPILSADTVIDRHLEPLAVELNSSRDGPQTYWLQTSPEFCMKRLLASGATAIYQVTRAFRAAERGDLHNVEFTMLEWYRVGDSMHDAMNLLSELCEELLQRGPAQRISYREAFLQFAGFDPHTASLHELTDAARRQDVAVLNSDDRHAWLNLLLTELVEPQLGREQPTTFETSCCARDGIRGGPLGRRSIWKVWKVLRTSAKGWMSKVS